MRVHVVSVAGSESMAQLALLDAKKAKTEVQCYECKGFGHYKNKCPLLTAKAAKSS